jgi:hypothetical protein
MVNILSAWYNSTYTYKTRICILTQTTRQSINPRMEMLCLMCRNIQVYCHIDQVMFVGIDYIYKQILKLFFASTISHMILSKKIK